MKHYLTFDESDTDAPRRIQFYVDQPPLMNFAACESSKFHEKADDIVKYSSKLPEIDLLKVYLQPLNENSNLMRFHNLASQRTVNVHINPSAVELSLTGNQEKKLMFESKLKWTKDEKIDIYDNIAENVDVKPLQFRTFEIGKDKVREKPDL